MKQVDCTLRGDLLEIMMKLGYFHDYSDDGWVEHEVAGWVPLNDIFENIFHSEVEHRDGKEG